MCNNKVIILGDNHHNALNLVRSFGVNNIKPIGIIVCDKKKDLFVTKSKYWESTIIIPSYKELIPILLSTFNNEKLKPVLFPCSDTAEMLIDTNLEVLAQYFIVPSLNHIQGSIENLMNKENQVKFAEENNIPIADTWVINSDNWENAVDNIEYPCIVKPVSSYEGKKTDIKKCLNITELRLYLKEIFENKNYSRILVQKYINYDYEITLVGSIDGCNNSYLITKTIRGWPIIGGTNSYFRIINNDAINFMVKHIIDVFTNKNYSGLFDIELFNVDGKIYLNEINWRNTGNSFLALGTNVHYAVIWYYSVIGAQDKKLKCFCTDEKQYAMNEATDLRHVFFNHYSIKKWNHDRKNTRSFALWFKGDNKPTKKRYKYLFRKLLLKNKVESK